MSTLVTADYQWDFDGLLVGVGTPYDVSAAGGFLDLSGVRASNTVRTRAHGGYVEPHYAAGAVLDLEFDIYAADQASFLAAVLALEAGTYPQEDTRPIWWQVPGHGLLTMQVQCVRRSIPLDLSYDWELVPKAALQFYAPDPLKYGPAQSLSTGLPTTSGGLSYPLAYPLAYGSASTGWVSASNPGSAPTSPIFTMAGPIDVGFQVTSIEDGITRQYNGTLGSTDTVVIDTRDGSVTLNDTADRRGLLSGSGWPVIPRAVAGIPGVRTFAFSTLGTYQAAASMTVAWAPAYW